MNDRANEFVRLVASGATRAEAYKKAYNRPELDNKDASKLAYKLAKKYEIREKLANITQQAEKEAVMSRAARMQFLTDMARASCENGKVRDAVACVAELNKMDGAYEPAKVEVQGDIVRDFVRAQIALASKEPLVRK